MFIQWIAMVTMSPILWLIQGITFVFSIPLLQLTHPLL